MILNLHLMARARYVGGAGEWPYFCLGQMTSSMCQLPRHLEGAGEWLI